MEVRLAKLYNSSERGVKVLFLDMLSVSQFSTIEKSLSIIEELHHTRWLLEFVEVNDKELIKFLNLALKDIAAKSVNWNSIKRQETEGIFLNTNRLFLNYLSSIKTFLDHSEVFLNRKFGDKSAEFLEYKNMLSVFYDNSFAYRFFYKLRNFSQHVGLPINSVSYETKYDREKNSKRDFLFVRFNRDELLEDFSKWGVHVKKDLEAMPEVFDVAPLIFEMTHNIREIERNIELLQKNDLILAANEITEFVKHIEEDNGEIFIAYDFNLKDNGEIANYRSLHIPFDTIKFIQEELVK